MRCWFVQKPTSAGVDAVSFKIISPEKKKGAGYLLCRFTGPDQKAEKELIKVLIC